MRRAPVHSSRGVCVYVQPSPVSFGMCCAQEHQRVRVCVCVKTCTFVSKSGFCWQGHQIDAACSRRGFPCIFFAGDAETFQIH